jgi:hypothetical protein
MKHEIHSISETKGRDCGALLYTRRRCLRLSGTPPTSSEFLKACNDFLASFEHDDKGALSTDLMEQFIQPRDYLAGARARGLANVRPKTQLPHDDRFSSE